MNAPVDKKESITKKLLLVGSDEIGLVQVQEFLNSCDIPSAKELAKEGINAEDISQILLRAHGVQANGGKHIQLHVDQVWNGLAMDLMMSNIDQDFWMWKDKDALLLLEYWKSLDSTLSFILVYNAPNKLFEELLQKETTPTIEELEEELEKWNSYNRELLNFYYRNQDRCILVNSQQVRSTPPTKLLEVGKEIGLDVESANIPLEILQETFNDAKQDDALYINLINTLVQNYPNALAMYDELQLSANLPYQQVDLKQISIYDAIKDYVETQKTLHKQEQSLLSKEIILKEQKQSANQFQEKLKQVEREKQSKNEENELLLAQLHSVQEVLEKRYLESQKIEKTLQEQEQSLQIKEKKVKEQEENANQLQEKLKQAENEKQSQNEENELLLAQLHSVQEELEKKYLESQKTEKTLQEKEQFLQAKDKTIKEQEEQVKKIQEELNSVKSENQNIQKDSQELKEENELLLAQLHMVQEELEAEYLKNVQQQKKKESQRVYGAADRIRQQLSYRLGAKMIENSKSVGGILALPFSLYGEMKKYRKEKKERKKQPPIHKYADAYEAEKLKKHLSYKLGSAMIESMKTPFGFFKLPFALIATHTKYKKEREDVSK
ncbi:hypothetical protein [Sulfurimonas sp.]|uniref:hypothetical protein n=1 Tax=Sulfurimonas sp. TaxID=2022749 RepID=UPI003D124B8C